MIESTMKAQTRQNGYVERNLTTHWTGARVSVYFIVELFVAALSARPVNSSVRQLRLGNGIMRLLLFILLTSLFASSPHPIQASQIRAVDWRNFTYPWYPSGYRSPYRVRKVTLKSGEYVVDERGNENDVLFSLANVSYADLTGDGKEEAIVTLTGIFNPNGSYACTFIYSMKGNSPRLLWKHETGDRAFGGLRSIRVDGSNLIVEQYDASFNDKPVPCMICSKRFVRASYRWNGKRFRKTKSETLPYNGNGIEFLGYPSDSR
ncbi:MAG TPA: hypothetical protein VFQ47_01510 [Nitrososphaera sp.]|nr:hypothetical protein [Nitrososphaera sp.]